jgi:polysaccharide export outer membrane protein
MDIISKIQPVFKIFILTCLIFNFDAIGVKASNLENSDINLRPKKEISVSENYNQAENLVARDYILGVNDIISIEFVGVPELTREIKIQPDGRISIPYMENFYVAGKTIPQVQAQIRAVYNEYLQDPQVNIKLAQTRPFIVYISGAVVNPGSYELNTIPGTYNSSKPEASIDRKTPLLSNVLIAAGGLTHDANLEDVTVTNDFDKSSFHLNLYDLIKNANSRQDIYLTAGDKVYVPRFPSTLHIDQQKYKVLTSSTLFQKAIPVKVMGYVNKPGYVVLSSQQSANLSSAIAQAGGYEDFYTPRKVLISRVDSNNKVVTFKVNPRQNEIMLMPDDTVYVPQKIRLKIIRMFDYTSKVFAPFYIFFNIYRDLDYINNH